MFSSFQMKKCLKAICHASCNKIKASSLSSSRLTKCSLMTIFKPSAYAVNDEPLLITLSTVSFVALRLVSVSVLSSNTLFKFSSNFFTSYISPPSITFTLVRYPPILIYFL